MHNFLIGNIGHFLNLCERQLLILIEEDQNNRLVAVHHECVTLCLDVYGLDIYASVVNKPCQIPVLIFLLVELLKLHGYILQFLG